MVNLKAKRVSSVSCMPRPIERYYSEALHGAIEDLWDKACTPAAVAENIVIADTFEDFDQSA
jgi:hypothetical protein